MNRFALENGSVLRDGQPIGTFDGTTFAPSEGLHGNTERAAVKFLESLPRWAVDPKPDGGHGGQGEPATALEGEGSEADARVPAFETPPSGEPPCPSLDCFQGDKEPAVVEWFHKYRPEEFAVRYRNRKTHLGQF